MDYPARARRVMEIEIAELQRLLERTGADFTAAVECLRSAVDARRKIIVCGVGKSGIIAAKLAATLTSTGAPAVVLNAQDALHGDLGIVNDGDALVVMSASGETDEILNLLPHLRRRPCPLVALTGGKDSSLAQAADIVLDTTVLREACPLNLAPTSSSTVMLVLSDALAMVLLEARGFDSEHFASLHPGGSLGRVLLTKVSSIMRVGERLPVVTAEATVMDAIHAMSRCRSGCALIAGPGGELHGIFTQGDFTRAWKSEPELAGQPVTRFMTREPVSIRGEQIAADLLRLLEACPVDEVPVVDAQGLLLGLVDTQDLSRHRIL